MKIARELAKEAKKKGICKEWYNQLKRLNEKRELIKMYVKGLDFCLPKNYPSNDYIRANFKGEMEEFGVFLDDELKVTNRRPCVALGNCKGTIEYNGYSVGRLYIKNGCNVEVNASDSSFVMIDIYDDATLLLNVVSETAKVCVNRYGGTVMIKPHSCDVARIKIVDKPKKIH